MQKKKPRKNSNEFFLGFSFSAETDRLGMTSERHDRFTFFSFRPRDCFKEDCLSTDSQAQRLSGTHTAHPEGVATETGNHYSAEAARVFKVMMSS